MNAGLRIILPWERPQTVVLAATIPLSLAMLCCGCETVFTAEGAQACPACGSRHALSLSATLNRATPADAKLRGVAG